MAKKHFVTIIALLLLSTALQSSTLSSHITHAQEDQPDLIVFYSQLNDDDDAEIYTIKSNGESLQQLTDNSVDDYDPGWSVSGNTIMFTSQRDNGIDHIFTMNAEGKDIQQITNDDKYYSFGHLSPDETEIMYVWYYDENNPGDVHIMNRDGSNLRRLTDTVGEDTAPRWSPDGQQISFMSNRDGNWEIYTMNIDGSNVRNLTNNPAQDRFPAWSPDGTQVAFHSDRSGNYDIYTMDTLGNNIHQITDDPSNDARVAWSSDGTRLIFNSERDGDYDLYSVKLDGSDLFQILNEPGIQASADVVAQPATVIAQTDTTDIQLAPLDTGVQAATEADCENFGSAALSQTRDNEVLLFADDFSTNCQDWLQDLSSQSIQDGKLYLTVDNGVENVASPSSNNADNAPTFTGDYAIEFTVSEFSGDSNLCVAIGFDRLPIGVSTMFQVCPVGTVMFAYDEANWEFPPTDFSTGEHHFRLEVSETNKSYRLLLNGNEIANFSQSFTRDTGITNGGIEIGLTRRGTNSTTYGSAAFDDISIWTPAVEMALGDSSNPTPTNIIPIIPVEEAVETLFIEDFSGNSANWEIHNDIRYLSTIENGRLNIQIKNAQRWDVQVGSKDRSTAPLVAGDYEIEFTVASFAADTDQVCFAIQFNIRTGHAPDEFALCQDGEWAHTQGESVTSGTYIAPDFSEGGHRIRLQVNQDTYTILIDDAVAAQISSVTPTRGSISVGITRSSDGPGTINASAEFDDVSIRLFRRGRAAKENVDGLEIYEGVNQQQFIVLTHEDIARGTLSGNSGCGDEPQVSYYLFYGYADHPFDIFMSYTVSSTDPVQPAAQGGFAVVDIQTQSVLATGQGLFTIPITFSVEDFEVPADGFYGIAVSSGVGFGCLLYDLAIYSEPSTAGEIASSTNPPLDAAAIPTSASIIFTSRRDENAEIYVMNPDGTNQRRLTNSEEDEIQPAPSPDGTRIAFNCKDGQYGEICVMNIDGSNRQNLTNDDDDEHDPTWSPDSSQIAFIRDFQIFVMNADGSGQHALSEENFSSLTGLAWSPDGTQLAFSAMGDSQLRHLFLINTDGSNLRELTNVAGDNAEYFEPAWSPDGSRIAFRNFVFENNSTALLIINADGSNMQTVLSNDASVGTPAWTLDGSQIIFHLDYDIYSINVDGTNLVRLTDDPNWDTEPEWLLPFSAAEVDVETAESTPSSTALPAETPVNVTGTPSQLENNEPQQTTLDAENAYFVEDFLDNSADWEIGSSPEYTARIENGRYSIELHEGTGWLVGAGFNDWNKAPIFSGQYEIVFNVTNIQSNTDNYCIVTLFHLQENYASFKRLSICGNGEWLFTDGERTFRDSYDPVDFLNGEIYQIKVQVTPATVKAYVNDALVGEVWIQSRANGSVGFGLTRIGDNSPIITASAEFDDLIVREIRTVSVADAPTTTPTTISEPTVANETATPTPAPVSVVDTNTAPQPAGQLDLIAFTSVFPENSTSEIYRIGSNGVGLQKLTDNTIDDYDPTWSSSGDRIMFVSRRDRGVDHIYTMNAVGANFQQITSGDDFYYSGQLSPDETQILYVLDEGETNPGEIYVMNQDGTNPLRLTNQAGYDSAPRWSPDGQQIAFMSDRDGNWEIYMMNADGSNVRNLTNNPAQDRFPAWSPDGTQLAFHSDRSGNYEIFTMDTQGNNIHQVTDDSSNDGRAAWSSDGARLIFSSDRDGDYDLYSINVDGSGLFQILNEPGSQTGADVTPWLNLTVAANDDGVFYTDSFDDNRGNWWQGEADYFTGSITNGKYLLTVVVPEEQEFASIGTVIGDADWSQMLNLGQPFELSFDFVASAQNPAQAGVGIFFDVQPEYSSWNWWSLGGDPSSFWNFYDRDTGIMGADADYWETPIGIIDGQQHTVTLRVTSDNYSVLVDGQPVGTVPSRGAIGGTVGFGARIADRNDIVTLEVDNFVVQAIVDEAPVAVGTGNELLDQGIAFRDQGDYLNALRSFTEAVLLDPADEAARTYGENLLTDYFILSPVDLNGWDGAPRDTSPSGPIPEGYDYNYPFALCGEIPVKALFIGVGAYEGYMSDGSFERASVQSAISFHRTPEEALETYNALLALFDGCTQGEDGFSSLRVNNASEIGSQTASYELSVPVSNFLGSGVMLGGMVIWTEENFVTITMYADTVFTFDVIQEIETTSQLAQANYVKLAQALSGN